MWYKRSMLNYLKGKKLYRSPKDAIMFGICAGLGSYLQVDPVFVRLVVLVAAFLSGGWPVLLAYVILVFIIPIDPSQDTVAPRQEPKDVTPDHPTEPAKSVPMERTEPRNPESVERMDSDQNM